MAGTLEAEVDIGRMEALAALQTVHLVVDRLPVDAGMHLVADKWPLAAGKRLAEAESERRRGAVDRQLEDTWHSAEPANIRFADADNQSAEAVGGSPNVVVEGNLGAEDSQLDGDGDRSRAGAADSRLVRNHLAESIRLQGHSHLVDSHPVSSPWLDDSHPAAGILPGWEDTAASVPTSRPRQRRWAKGAHGHRTSGFLTPAGGDQGMAEFVGYNRHNLVEAVVETYIECSRQGLSRKVK
jgi:hypothetical protein